MPCRLYCIVDRVMKAYHIYSLIFIKTYAYSHHYSRLQFTLQNVNNERIICRLVREMLLSLFWGKFKNFNDFYLCTKIILESAIKHEAYYKRS